MVVLMVRGERNEIDRSVMLADLAAAGKSSVVTYPRKLG